jgi:hypothetical protein
MSILSSRTAIIALTLVTAGVHLFLGYSEGSAMFYANGAGYLTLLFLTFWTPAFLKGQTALIRWAFIGYAVITIIAYFASWGVEGFSQIVGMITKVDELLLVIGLWQSKGK